MATGLKTFVRKVVEVVAPPPPPQPPPPSPGPRNEEPVLGHRAGLDQVIYGAADSPAVRDVSGYSGVVNGKTYKLFFLVGHQRSGTHWMDHILNRHPKIFVNGEFRFESLRSAFDDLTGKPWHAAYRDPMKSEAERCFRESVRRILASLSEHRPWADWMGDRTPRSLQVYLPGAPHFLILRDPRDVLVSWTHMEFRNGGHHYNSGGFAALFDMHRGHFLKDPEYFDKNPGALLANEAWVKRLADAWRTHTRADLATLRAIKDGKTDARAMVLRYEEVYADPEKHRRSMYEFLGVNPAEAEELSELTKSSPGFEKPNPHGIYRKGEVGDWRRFFGDDVKRWFKEQAGDTLIELGYENDHNW